MVNIKRAKVEDAQEIYKLCLLFNNTATATTLEQVEKFLNQSKVTVLIAVVNDEYIGFISGKVEENLSFGRPIVNINEVFVKEEYRLGGVVTQLFTAFEQTFCEDGFNRFRVFTTADNQKAVQFYHSRGYDLYETAMFRKDF